MTYLAAVVVLQALVIIIETQSSVLRCISFSSLILGMLYLWQVIGAS